ncbi:hypothetical protein ABIC80_004409, partial [Kosakonia sp. 1610]
RQGGERNQRLHQICSGSVAIYDGIMMMTTMTQLGVLSGTIIIVNGVNTISCAAARTLLAR